MKNTLITLTILNMLININYLKIVSNKSRSEIMGLKWQNIDFDKNMILVSHAMVQIRINGKSVCL